MSPRKLRKTKKQGEQEATTNTDENGGDETKSQKKTTSRRRGKQPVVILDNEEVKNDSTDENCGNETKLQKRINTRRRRKQSELILDGNTSEEVKNDSTNENCGNETKPQKRINSRRRRKQSEVGNKEIKNDLRKSKRKLRQSAKNDDFKVEPLEEINFSPKVERISTDSEVEFNYKNAQPILSQQSQNEIAEQLSEEPKINTTYEKGTPTKTNTTYEKEDFSAKPCNTALKENKKNNTFDKTEGPKINTTYEKDEVTPTKTNTAYISAKISNTVKGTRSVRFASPASIKKRRGTYELNQSVNDVSVLKSLSEENTPKKLSTPKRNVLENKASLLRKSFSCLSALKTKSTPQIQKTLSQSSIEKNHTSYVTERKKDISVLGLNSETSIPWEIENTPFNNAEKIFLNTPPSDSSTPFVKNKGDQLLLKAAIKNDASTKKRRSLNKSSNVSFKADKSLVKKTLRTKMPNFSMIHQKAFEKMEDIQQFTQRKAERAKLLLSGMKPALGNNTSQQSPKGSGDLNNPKASKKQLQFSINEPDKTIIPATPLTSNNNEDSLQLLNGLESPVVVKLNKSKLTPLKTSKIKTPKVNLFKSKTVENLPLLANPVSVLSKIPLKSSSLNNMKNPTNKSGNAIIKINNKMKKVSPVKKITTKLAVPIQNNKCGLKPAVRVNKQEQAKAVANKTRVAKDIVKIHRDELKGVRTNRRFELLMKMRNK